MGTEIQGGERAKWEASYLTTLHHSIALESEEHSSVRLNDARPSCAFGCRCDAKREAELSKAPVRSDECSKQQLRSQCGHLTRLYELEIGSGTKLRPYRRVS